MNQKDAIIARLRAENQELMEKSQDYLKLKGRLSDLEHQFKMLQEEKLRSESIHKERNAMSWRQDNNSQEELRRIDSILADREKDLRDINANIEDYKSALASKDEELGRLRKDKVIYEENNAKLADDKMHIQRELMEIDKEYTKTKKETDILGMESRILENERAALVGRAREAEDELKIMKRKVQEIEDQLEMAKRGKNQKEEELESIKVRSPSRDESQRWKQNNEDLERENYEISQRIAEIEAQISVTKKRCNDGSLLLEDRTKKLTELKSEVSYLENQDLKASVDLRKAHEEKELLERMLDRYREDVEFQKRLRQVEASKKIELELEKKKLQSEALSREIEARSARRELERVRDSHGMLLNDKDQMNEELNALKEHAELLESQNIELSNELDVFADTGEKVRRELDRKPRVEYLKSKNNEEIQRSSDKVRSSISPRGSPYKTPSYY